jgi:hypothetical protein
MDASAMAVLPVHAVASKPHSDDGTLHLNMIRTVQSGKLQGQWVPFLFHTWSTTTQTTNL